MANAKAVSMLRACAAQRILTLVSILLACSWLLYCFPNVNMTFMYMICFLLDKEQYSSKFPYLHLTKSHPHKVISRDTEAYKGYHKLCSSILSGSVQSLNVSDEIPRYTTKGRLRDNKNKTPDPRSPHLVKLEQERLGSSPGRYASSDDGDSSPLNSHRYRSLQLSLFEGYSCYVIRELSLRGVPFLIGLLRHGGFFLRHGGFCWVKIPLNYPGLCITLHF